MGPITQNAIGGFIANGAYGVLILVLSRIKEEIKLAREYKNELQELEVQLNGLNDLLPGPILSSTNNVLMHNWLNKVNNAAHDVDDLLDDYSYDALKLGRRKRDMLNDFVISHIDAHRFAHRAKDLWKLIGSIYKEGSKLGIKPIKVAEWGPESQEQRLHDQREWVDDQGLVGRDHDLILLANFLCDPNNSGKDLSIIGITGMPGLGKTALSKRLAKVQEVIRHFNSHIFWLVVSHNWDLTDILKRMVEQLHESASNMSDSRAMVRKLREKLNGKRFLLILDDVWGTIHWEPLRCAVHDIGGSKGTTLLVTSCDKNVLEKMDTHGTDTNGQNIIHKAVIHRLEGINKDDSWSLFILRVGSGNLDSMEKLNIGSRMVKKCGGNPHAIRAIGDLLRNRSVENWQDIERNLEGYDILPSLKLSYLYLPSMALKKCFLYCAIFGEDEVIQKDKLIQMWMGQGFLQPYDDDMERVGDVYFNMLLNSSLLQDEKYDERGNVIAVKMHGLVLSLARIASAQEFLILHEQTKVKENSSRTKFRHLSTSTLLSEDLIASEFCENLRTYYSYCPQFHYEMFKSLELMLKHSKCLRVLCLQHLGLETLPIAIGELKHLRFLDVSENCFEIIPVVITSLYHLQTLRIDYNTKCELRCSVSKREVSNLKNLRHISAKSVDIGIFEGMGHLTALQTLSTINLKSNWSGRLSELSSLTNLRGKLGIRGVEYIKCEQEARSLNLGKLPNVDRLILEWSENLPADDRQDQILQVLEPHSNLATFEVAHYNGFRLPEWLIKMTVVRGFQQFPNLVSLTLRHCFYAMGNLNLNNFTSLRFLSLLSCYDLTISLPENGFHNSNMLESLKLSSCFNVGNLGDLSPLTRLQHLEIINCAKTTYELMGLASLPCLKEVITDRLLPRDLGGESPLRNSLRSLHLSAQQSDSRILPVELQHLVALQELHICDFQGMESLPDWLGNLSSLSLLDLSSMPRLKLLPSQVAMQSLSSLRLLSVRECPALKKQFTAKNGEWFKINRIPSIIVDFQPLDKTKF